MFRIVGSSIFAATVLFGQISLSVNVPATSNPYLAGMPNGTKARVGDSAPQQSPVLAPRPLTHAVAVTFTAVGTTQHTPECPPRCYGPKGAEFRRHDEGAENGIAEVTAPINALMGVFLSDEPPDRSSAPRSLDYRKISRDIDTFLRYSRRYSSSVTEGQVKAFRADIWFPRKLQGCIWA